MSSSRDPSILGDFCPVSALCFASISWLHGSFLTLVILERKMEHSPCMSKLCRIFIQLFLFYNIWEMWSFCFMTFLLISMTTTLDSLDWVFASQKPAEIQLAWISAVRGPALVKLEMFKVIGLGSFFLTLFAIWQIWCLNKDVRST